MTHHPHVHMIVPGGGLSPDGKNWIASRSNFFLSVRVLSRLFRRLVLTKLLVAHKEKRLEFFGAHTALADEKAFAAFLSPLRRQDWAVYSKRPFSSPDQVLSYLSRYTHRVAIANSRLIAADDEKGVTFKYKDYRVEGPARHKTMTLSLHEFIRRFLMHVLPRGFHRIRHYGLFANGNRAENLAKARALLGVTPTEPTEATSSEEPENTEGTESEPRIRPCPCPLCGGRMIITREFDRDGRPAYRSPVAPIIRIDTS